MSDSTEWHKDYNLKKWIEVEIMAKIAEILHQNISNFKKIALSCTQMHIFTLWVALSIFMKSWYVYDRHTDKLIFHVLWLHFNLFIFLFHFS